MIADTVHFTLHQELYISGLCSGVLKKKRRKKKTDAQVCDLATTEKMMSSAQKFVLTVQYCYD